MSEISQVRELISPLSNDSDRVFDEGDHDEESADGRKISACSRGQLLPSDRSCSSKCSS